MSRGLRLSERQATGAPASWRSALGGRELRPCPTGRLPWGLTVTPRGGGAPGAEPGPGPAPGRVQGTVTDLVPGAGMSSEAPWGLGSDLGSQGGAVPHRAWQPRGCQGSHRTGGVSGETYHLCGPERGERVRRLRGALSGCSRHVHRPLWVGAGGAGEEGQPCPLRGSPPSPGAWGSS